MAQGGEPADGAWIGRPLKRREDHRLLVGSGRYVDDISPQGCVHVVLLRSPHAHPRIARLDVEAARRAPRVVAVVPVPEVKHLLPIPGNRCIPHIPRPPITTVRNDSPPPPA